MPNIGPAPLSCTPYYPPLPMSLTNVVSSALQSCGPRGYGGRAPPPSGPSPPHRIQGRGGPPPLSSNRGGPMGGRVGGRPGLGRVGGYRGASSTSPRGANLAGELYTPFPPCLPSHTLTHLFSHRGVVTPYWQQWPVLSLQKPKMSNFFVLTLID